MPYVTPRVDDNEGDDYCVTLCFQLSDPLWLAHFYGALYPLTVPENWESVGGISPERAAQRFRDIFAEVLIGRGY